ncbi:response regulator [Pontiella sulfatireligans]|uniref:Transcriptional activator protein CopR n=1 Tax=Pontiella sulfatireligans TaxID=2750658 RepID=A0A6C2UPR0_9BACT|nr:response regulator [Pontiella sulfatireligans]VGO20996.1 Transcriptional activator protein CopR [Pontiella sulfatireligans]
MNLLLIEDDPKIALFVVKGLQRAGYAVEHAADGEAGLRLALEGDHGLLIVDLMLPGLDGMEIIRRFREHGRSTPILILSAKSVVEDRVEGLQAGADDYLVKPFSFAELLARVEARTRRYDGLAAPQELCVANLRVDLLRNKVFRGETEIELQPLEYILLVYLMRQTGRVVSKDTILQQVWEYNAGAHTNVVEARIYKLRDKVDRDFEPKLIHTVRGAGYALEIKG